MGEGGEAGGGVELDDAAAPACETVSTVAAGGGAGGAMMRGEGGGQEGRRSWQGGDGISTFLECAATHGYALQRVPGTPGCLEEGKENAAPEASANCQSPLRLLYPAKGSGGAEGSGGSEVTIMAEPVGEGWGPLGAVAPEKVPALNPKP